MVAAPRPFLLTPPVRGTSQYIGETFVPTPLMPPPEYLDDVRITRKFLNFADLPTAAGTARIVLFIENFSAYITFNGLRGALNGRARHYFQDDVGLVEANWAAEIDLDGQWARVESQILLAAYSDESAPGN